MPWLLLQIEGFSLNATTLGVITLVVTGLVGALGVVFRWATANQTREITRLERDNAELLEALIDVLRTAKHSTDVADAAADLLHQRRTRKPR